MLSCITQMHRFNRYMVECEFVEFTNIIRSRNGFNRYMVECECRLWHFQHLLFSRFNRYMVECEYKLGAGVEEVPLVLIDTWWNVNRF